MHYSTEDTIAAIASAPGGGARGIVRISGPQAVACVADCFSSRQHVSLLEQTSPQQFAGEVQLSRSNRKLPCQLLLWPDTRSYTQQPSAELHTIGSYPLLTELLETVCQSGARLAQPGEFTLRSFLAGRLDLTQAEAVLGVIDAQTGSQLETALAQLAGGISRPLHTIRESMLQLLAHLEAGLDFVEEDIEFITVDELDAQLHQAQQEIARVESQMQSRTADQPLPRVVLAGWPNTGKSSLFNALVSQGSARALVSDEAGTTRDYLSARVEFLKLPCELIDTAGIEPSVDPESIASYAQQHTSEQQQQAHLRLLCLDRSRALNDWEKGQLEAYDPQQVLLVWTKCDLEHAALNCSGTFGSISRNTLANNRNISAKNTLDQHNRTTSAAERTAIETSSETGLGLDKLSGEIVRRLELQTQQDGDSVAGTASRCRESLRLANEALTEARQLAQAQAGEELVAAEIRHALAELGKVVGAVYTDDILDRIFSRFCIGK